MGPHNLHPLLKHCPKALLPMVPHLPLLGVALEDSANLPHWPQRVGGHKPFEEVVTQAPRIQADAHITTAGITTPHYWQPLHVDGPRQGVCGYCNMYCAGTTACLQDDSSPLCNELLLSLAHLL